MNYVRVLTEAGVPVEFHLYPGGYHEFETIVSDSEISKRAVSDSIRALNEALNTN